MATRSKAKALVRAENKDRRPKAIAKYIRISPSKVMIVLDLIRGKDYKDAVAILRTTPKAACELVLKCLNLKRMQPVSRGRGYRILKRTSHITVILDERA